MSRKDFELIAASLNSSKPPGDTGDRLHQWEAICFGLAGALAHSNPRFDRSRFLAACGVSGEH